MGSVLYCVILFVILALLPFYVYLLSKFASVGKLAGAKTFMRMIQKGDRCGTRKLSE